ncbi:MAG: hypothetical protein GY751_00325 [Bacteroidetes bacterium]|nr:hypothetical protein [Bacteroidota bacterium]
MYNIEEMSVREKFINGWVDVNKKDSNKRFANMLKAVEFMDEIGLDLSVDFARNGYDYKRLHKQVKSVRYEPPPEPVVGNNYGKVHIEYVSPNDVNKTFKNKNQQIISEINNVPKTFYETYKVLKMFNDNEDNGKIEITRENMITLDEIKSLHQEKKRFRSLINDIYSKKGSTAGRGPRQAKTLGQQYRNGSRVFNMTMSIVREALDIAAKHEQSPIFEDKSGIEASDALLQYEQYDEDNYDDALLQKSFNYVAKYEALNSKTDTTLVPSQYKRTGKFMKKILNSESPVKQTLRGGMCRINKKFEIEIPAKAYETVRNDDVRYSIANNIDYRIQASGLARIIITLGAFGNLKEKKPLTTMFKEYEKDIKKKVTGKAIDNFDSNLEFADRVYNMMTKEFGTEDVEELKQQSASVSDDLEREVENTTINSDNYTHPVVQLYMKFHRKDINGQSVLEYNAIQTVQQFKTSIKPIDNK